MAAECSALELELLDVALGVAEAPAHVAGCAECQARLEAQRGLWAAVSALPRRRPVAPVRSAVLAAAGSADDVASATEPKRPPRRPSRDGRRDVLGAAAKLEPERRLP